MGALACSIFVTMSSGFNQPGVGKWLVLLLCLISISFFDGYPRYQAIGPELLRDPKLASLADWGGQRAQVKQDDNGAMLIADDSQRSVWLSQAFAGPFPGLLLLLRCEMKTENVVKGIKDWETARVVLLSKNAAGKAMYDRPHVLNTLEGNHDWHGFEKAFAIDDDAVSLEVAAQLNQSRGKLWVRNFSLRPVQVKNRYFEVLHILQGAWLTLLAWMALPILRASLRSRSHAWLTLLIAGILIGVALPHDLKGIVEGYLFPEHALAHADQVERIAADGQFFDFSLQLPPLEAFKIGHFVLFGLLAMTLVSGKPYRLTLSATLAYLLLMAMTSEVLQLLIPGRSSQLGDIGIDMLGATCGILLAKSLSLSRRLLRGQPHDDGGA